VVTGRTARLIFGGVAAVAGVAVVLQLILVLNGSAALIAETPPPLPQRVIRFFSYFTVQSNLLVLVTTTALARGFAADSRLWQVLRIDAMTGILITGVVHFLLLRPLLDLSGASLVADKLLHLAVPILAVAGWLIAGPRRSLTPRAYAWSLAWPVAWLVITLSVGWVTRWYPYPFLNAREHGAGSVAVYCAAIAVAFIGASALIFWVDRRPRESTNAARPVAP
jgi:hypothetical protein